ncbi:hypothetical protein AB1Y20_006098 [Prymnesium parvum]|uniref:Hexosyltransferase n=1 Tax=Prymnesium parvum TaxID=97485 RepID=A0AB34J1B2_PRYPA
MAAPSVQPCDGSSAPYRLLLGAMSRPSNSAHRAGVRATWARASPSLLVCFLVGDVKKLTPRAPWDPRPSQQPRPRGELLPLDPEVDAALRSEHLRFGDVLRLRGSAEIDSGGTSGLKTLTWWRHAARAFPHAEWVGKCDDDTLLHVPRLLERLPRAADSSPRALLGTIKWGCYSDKRFKWEPSWKSWPCGRTQFARSQAPGEPANLSLTYEGPYQLALGWFFAMPRALVEMLASCRYAAWFLDQAIHATKEPFLRKEDDPLNGFWIYKCLRERYGPDAHVEPLPSLREAEAHNMACISPRGLYRRPSNQSIAVHFLKTPSALRYVAAVLRWERRGEPRHSQRCCARMVWPSERSRQPPSVCDSLLSPREVEEEAAVDAGEPLLGRGGGRRRRGKGAGRGKRRQVPY